MEQWGRRAKWWNLGIPDGIEGLLTSVHLFFLYTISYNQLFLPLMCAAVTRGFRYNHQVLRAPPSLTTPDQSPGATQTPAHGPRSAPRAISPCPSDTAAELVSSCAQRPRGGAWCLGLPCARLGWDGVAASPTSAGQVTVLGPWSLSLGRSCSSLLPANHTDMSNRKTNNFDFLDFFHKAKTSRPMYYLCQSRGVQRRRNNARIFLPRFRKTAVLCVMATKTWKGKLMIDNIH